MKMIHNINVNININIVSLFWLVRRTLSWIKVIQAITRRVCVFYVHRYRHLRSHPVKAFRLTGEGAYKTSVGLPEDKKSCC